MERPTRRHVLALAGVTAATSVAGCATGGDGTTERTTTETETTVETTTETEMTVETTTEPETTVETTTATEQSTRVVVGPAGDFRFAPSAVTVAVGDTVEWTWSSSGHNVIVESKPEESEFTGTEALDGSVYDAGYSISHTFEVAGTYEYYCAPHRASGMVGEVVVES